MNGIINLNKPKGPTSCQIVNDIKHLLKIKKIGHIGTLDPEVTGLLPLCIGKATKIVEFISNFEKIYTGMMRLGITTDTQDATGRVLSVKTAGVSDEELRDVLKEFTGEIAQVPPMYSAAKYKGKRLYELARKGITVDVSPKRVMIHSLDLVGRNSDLVQLKVRCSRGTYIRTLFHDIGERLGCGAHMVELKRIKIGSFDISDSLTVSEIEELKRADKLEEAFISIDQVLEFLSCVHVALEHEKKVLNGMPVQKQDIKHISKDFLSGNKILIKNQRGDLLAIGEALVSSVDLPEIGDNDPVFRPKKILV